MEKNQFDLTRAFWSITCACEAEFPVMVFAQANREL